MTHIEQLQRWVAIVEQFSDERAELVVSEMRDAIELMRASDPCYVVSVDDKFEAIVYAKSESHAISAYLEYFLFTGSMRIGVRSATQEDSDSHLPIIRGKTDE